MIVGLDLSLTGAGVAVIDEDTQKTWLSVHGSKASPRVPSPAHKGRKKDKGIVPVEVRAARIQGVANSVLKTLPIAPRMALIEAPSYGSQNGMAHERSGLFWAIAMALAPETQLIEVPPRVRALYATGDGGADKKAVVAATLAMHKLSTRNDNIIDAFVLAKMGCRHIGRPIDLSLPEVNLTAMSSVYWPN